MHPIIWFGFITVFIFLKPEFSGPEVWRVNQCASHLCDSFDGLLLNASTARGNFCGIRLEVSLYYVCDRIFSLVTLLYVQRITCGNLWIRMLKTFFVKASDRPNLLFLWVQIRIGWCWCKDQCGWIWRILRNDLVRISLLADFRFQICVLLMVHYFLNSFVAFYWAEFSYQGVFRFSSVQSVLASLRAETAFQARTESDRHRRGDRSRTPAKIQWSQIRGAHCFEHIIVANILIIPPPSSRRAQADSRRRADAHTQGDFPCVPTCRETWYMDFCKHRSWRRFLQEAPRLRSRAVILQVCNL